MSEPALFQPSWFPELLPLDVDLASVQRFLTQRFPAAGALTTLWVGLTGAHAYGFPSPDADLDLKAVHLAEACDVLGVGKVPAPIEHLSLFEGREMDFFRTTWARSCRCCCAATATCSSVCLAR